MPEVRIETDGARNERLRRRGEGQFITAIGAGYVRPLRWTGAVWDELNNRVVPKCL